MLPHSASAWSPKNSTRNSYVFVWRANCQEGGLLHNPADQNRRLHVSNHGSARAPTAHGTEDRVVPTLFSRALHRMMPGSHLHLTQGVSRLRSSSGQLGLRYIADCTNGLFIGGSRALGGYASTFHRRLGDTCEWCAQARIWTGGGATLHSSCTR